MNDGRYVALRPEARPMPREVLNDSQLKAMKGVVAALKEAVDQVQPSEDRKKAVGFIAPDRVSRLFFVSGEPGTGKTSIYETLRALLSKEKWHFEYSEKYKCAIPDLSSLESAIRWLDPMDLEVAGDEGENLLAAVLVRISEALDDPSGMPSKDCRDAMEKLSSLANDIGIAWDGNLKARAASLDPDSYSQEVMRAQRTRLGTNTRFREALDAVLSNDCYGCEREEIFVLPIDDFYLKPNASLELLRLLRMVSVPRLFFLIMGDIKTMEALFFEKALADWTNVAGAQVFASLAKRREGEILPRIREMKARYLRKLLPPGQRAIIGWTQWHEAIRYEPSAGASTGNLATLGQLLSQISVWYRGPDNDPNPMALLNFLFSPACPEAQTVNANDQKSAVVNCWDSISKESTEEEIRLKRCREAYSALLILDATPREVADLWMVLKELLNDSRNQNMEYDASGAPRYLRKIVDFALLAIEEQDYLTEEQQDILRFTFPKSEKDDLLFQTEELTLVAKESLPQPVLSEDAFVRRHLDWKLGVSNDKGTAGPVPFLPPRTAAWIILLHDLTWSWNRDRVTINLIRPLREALLKEKRWKRPTLDTLGWAWYKNENALWVHFPLPKLNTFRQLDRFLAVWNDVLQQITKISTRKELVRGWAFANWIAEGPGTPEDPKDLYDQFARDHLKMPKNDREEPGGFETFKHKLLEENKDFRRFASGGPQ